MKKRNPYLSSYLGLAMICCLALCLIFFYINNKGMEKTYEQFHQKKVEMMAEDLETQLELFQEIALRIKINTKYHLYNLKKNSYNEMVMLEDFEQYSKYSALTEECFLYYGGEKIYCSFGHTADLDVYLEALNGEEKEQLLYAMNKPGKGVHLTSVARNLYVIIPFSMMEGTGRTNVVLCFVVSHENLENRFRIVSGGVEGNISLFSTESLLYSNRETACAKNQKDVLNATAKNGSYSICLLPDKNSFAIEGLIPLQISLILIDVLFMLGIANIFARQSYRPILEMTDRYRQKVSVPDEIQCENALEEINYMMDSVFQSNTLFNMQINQKKEMLHRQILQILLNGNYSFDIQNYTDKLQIRLPGPWFYVISISFVRKENVSEETMDKLRDGLESIFVEDDGEYVYAVCDYKKKQLSIICSIEEEMQKEELTEYICEMAECYGYELVIGIGNVYQNLSRISASWLESMDNIHQKITRQNAEPQPVLSYEPDELLRISSALSIGDEAGAMVAFSRYISRFEKEQMSFLMLKCVVAEFLSAVSKVANEKRIELSNQNVSLIITAQNIESFKETAQELMHAFCNEIEKINEQMENDEAQRICNYINLHFSDYDLSIEKTAADLNTTTAMVRQSVLKLTGKMYKDYIIFLRIEYAKKLLLKDNMTVADTCQQVGYGNISYFIKLFKEITGVTPAKYKKTEERDDEETT